MRFTSTSVVALAVALVIIGCSGKSPSSSTSHQSNAPATSAAASSAAGELPTYPGALIQASGSSSNSASSAAGKVMSTDDSFDKVYAWYQQKMPAGSEKSHITSPVESAVFTIGDLGNGQSSLTLSTQGGKTMITIAHVKM
jgi:hypothetical protein